ncbi:hypothetical protein [Haliangium sp.]|uniref:hypothetical protein n=1 Tax=Haliangium sp. TaxID=2663208 RepID=UPI003D10F442
MSTTRRPGPRARPRWRVALAGLAVLAAAAGCEEDTANAADSVRSAWTQGGLMPTPFTALEAKDMSPGVCEHGLVNGIEVVLCQYADPATARAAQNAGLARVGETTGLALAAGTLVLIAADRDQADPSGRDINKLARIFRDTLAPPASEGDGDAGPKGKGDGKGDGKGKSRDKKAT